MLDKLNVFIQKYIAILTPLSVVLGVLLENIGQNLLFLVTWLFAFMTFAGSLHMKFKDVKIFVKHPVLIVFTIVFLHLLMPLWVYFLSTIVFDDHLLIVGFVLSVAVPTGVTSVIWIKYLQRKFAIRIIDCFNQYSTFSVYHAFNALYHFRRKNSIRCCITYT